MLLILSILHLLLWFKIKGDTVYGELAISINGFCSLILLALYIAWL